MRGLSALLHRSGHEFAGRPGKELVTPVVGHVGQSGHRITSLWPKNEGIVVVSQVKARLLAQPLQQRPDWPDQAARFRFEQHAHHAHRLQAEALRDVPAFNSL